MSTTNHYILYFVCVSGISLLNTGLCLWKAQNPLAQRGFREPGFASIFVQPSFSQPASGLKCKTSPIRNREQGAKLVHFTVLPVRAVEIRGQFHSKNPPELHPHQYPR